MLPLKSHFTDVVPDGLPGLGSPDAKVFGVFDAPLGQLVVAERRAGRARVGVSVHGIDGEVAWLGTRSNKLHAIGRAGGVDGEVAGEPPHVQREPVRVPWKSRRICIQLGDRAYTLVRQGCDVSLLDHQGDVVARTDSRQEWLADHRSYVEHLVAILCFAGNLDDATCSPLASVFV